MTQLMASLIKQIAPPDVEELIKNADANKGIRKGINPESGMREVRAYENLKYLEGEMTLSEWAEASGTKLSTLYRYAVVLRDKHLVVQTGKKKWSRC